ncbi:hypothetical protein Salat_0626600 [Sesamum alatum]|uniref:Uncharacterized protein n=1 Tax=Sesamum alatum TaxID=300844 RepID=A0AAE1YS35_9LAMI|nr:hypothetical protein Salat_0626600 [Sesamum alatum]
MSRCFPYPPPGYTLSRATNEALIESIKLQKGKEKAKEQKKEKKREKREKRKENKERRKQNRDKTNQNLEKSDIVKDQIGQKICSDRKGEFHHNSREAETDQLERSSLTEDHGQPVSLPGPSSSSDSTENTNKRKRHSSVTPMDGSHSHGKVILIRLPSKKQNESDALEKVGLGSFQKDLITQSKDNAGLRDRSENSRCVSFRTDFPTQSKDDIGRRNRLENTHSAVKSPSNIKEGGITVRSNSEQVCSTSGQIEAVAPSKTGIKSVNKTVPTSLQKLELQYKNLLENWEPPRPEDGYLYADDPDWLFHDKDKKTTHAKKRQRCGSNSISCSRSSTWRPHKEYLHEIDVYALPFTVPY